jgi:hypothetical protein
VSLDKVMMPVPDGHPDVFDREWPLRVPDIDRDGRLRFDAAARHIVDIGQDQLREMGFEPQTAAEEDRARRKKAFEEQAKVRAIYEELVLKKPQPTVVQIGTVSDITKAVPANFSNAAKPVSIAPASGNGHTNGNGRANGNGTPASQAEKATEAVAGD